MWGELKNGNFVKISKTTLLEILIKQLTIQMVLYKIYRERSGPIFFLILRISLKNGNFVKISKTTLLEILIKQHARCGNIGPHIKFGGLSFTNKKVVTVHLVSSDYRH